MAKKFSRYLRGFDLVLHDVLSTDLVVRSEVRVVNVWHSFIVLIDKMVNLLFAENNILKIKMVSLMLVVELAIDFEPRIHKHYIRRIREVQLAIVVPTKMIILVTIKRIQSILTL